MSEFNVQVIRINKIEKHPNADTLSVTHVMGDYPVIFKSGDFKEGQLAAYVPVDAIVPQTPEWEFLGKHRQIKAKKLRGVFSMGLLTTAPPGAIEGQNVQEALGIIKYDPDIVIATAGDCEKDPGFIPIYTDIEGFRKYPDLFIDGEQVAILEKIHGANGRFCYYQNRLWCGSHRQIKRDGDILWWRIARQYNLAKKLAGAPGVVFYGESYGRVQDLHYGLENSIALAMFDAFSIEKGHYLDFADFKDLCRKLDLPIAPILYEGPWSKSLSELRNGKTEVVATVEIGGTLKSVKGGHNREGVVVKSAQEQFCAETGGRRMLKYVGEDYLLR